MNKTEVEIYGSRTKTEKDLEERAKDLLFPETFLEHFIH